MVRKLLEVAESHSYCENVGIDTAIDRHLVTKNRAAGGIHDEPDVSLDDLLLIHFLVIVELVRPLGIDTLMHAECGKIYGVC